MTLSPTIRLAKQGDAQAIAQLINQQLQPRGITAQATLKGHCLHLQLEAAGIVPPQPAVVTYLRQSLERLGAAEIRDVQITACQRGQADLGWETRLPLLPAPERRALRRRRRSGFRRCLRIWAHWQAIALGVSFVFLLVLVAMSLFLMLVASDLDWQLPEVNPRLWAIALATLFFWGLILGDAQTEVLLQRLRRAPLWKWATAVGLPLGLAFGLWLRFYGYGDVVRLVGLLPFSIDASVFFGVIMPLAAGGGGFFILGLLQWLSIWGATRRAHRWLVATTAGGAVSGLIGATGSQVFATLLLRHWRLTDLPALDIALRVLLCTLLVWFSYQAITGVTMARMLHRRPKVKVRLQQRRRSRLFAARLGGKQSS